MNSEDSVEDHSEDIPAEGQLPKTNRVILYEYAKNNKVELSLWATRLLTIFFGICYLMGLQETSFNRILLTNAATSAIRLHQRLPAFELNRRYLTKFLLEDSTHYFLYSLIFFNTNPNFMVMMPTFLFAVLHATSYALKLISLTTIGFLKNLERFFASFMECQASYLLRLVAFSEIFLMLYVLLLTFMSETGVLTPLIYYHFLHMRYMSRRNPYTRDSFTQLRMLTEITADHCPTLLRNILHIGIALVCRMA